MRLRPLLAGAGVDALLVTDRPTVRYLTGFTGSSAMLLVTDDALVFTSDGRYRTQAEEQLTAAGVGAQIEIGATVAQQRDALAAALSSGARVGLEAHAVTWAQQRDLADALAGHELVPTNGLVEQLRRVKEPAEVARIRAACAIADDALAELLPRLAERPTERDFALDLEVEMRRRGASGNSFDPIVASGPNAAKPHARPSARVIERGELVVIDFGCIVDGYCSDMTRTVSVGDPGADARRVWDVVRESQSAGPRRGAAPAPTARPSTGRAATSSRPRAGATRSCTAPATAWVWRSTRSPESPRVPVIPWNPVRSSRSSPACISLVWAACASRTRWSSPPTAPIRSLPSPST